MIREINRGKMRGDEILGKPVRLNLKLIYIFVGLILTIEFI